MKRRTLFLLFALLIFNSAIAQTGKYYINDRETTKEEILALTAEQIGSMSNGVENGIPVVRITLKSDTDNLPAAENKLRITVREGESPEDRKAEMMKQVYEQTTLLKEGDLAAGFTADKPEGDKVSLEQFRGKVVLLNFWATWCAPCLRELAPEALPKVILERFAENDDFIFLPVAYTDTMDSLDKFFREDEAKDYSYLRSYTVIDPDKSIFSIYATQGVPRSFVIGRNGTIQLGSLGADPGELHRIADAIEKVLEE